ncbi:hypothetical protein LNP74_15125 [Klebsiella pneumoniae subsp. pneumoniae]|nr:hypothetical protein [Klebsiella pneumoniae subsp. pneumoniae]
MLARCWPPPLLRRPKELKAIGVTVGDLANPFFVQITKGAGAGGPQAGGG